MLAVVVYASSALIIEQPSDDGLPDVAENAQFSKEEISNIHNHASDELLEDQSSIEITDEQLSVGSQSEEELDYAEDLALRFIGAGLVGIGSVDATIQVDLRYSGTNNFLGKDLYGDLAECYVQPAVAEKLKVAQMLLKCKYPAYSIVVLDAVRPKHVQKQMWDEIELPAAERKNFLAHPSYGSLHNYGAAVDVSIVNEYGETIDMGTPFDFAGELAYPSKEVELMNAGELTIAQVVNRRLLRGVMQQAGFSSVSREWWHFNACSMEEAKVLYRQVQ